MRIMRKDMQEHCPELPQTLSKPGMHFLIHPFKLAARLKCAVNLAKSYLKLEFVFEGLFAVSHL
jgi:hypothetical protein